MSETSDKAAAAKLEAAQKKAEKLRILQEEAAREIAEAEALEAAEVNEREKVKAQRAKEALHRAAEKQRLREEKRAAEAAAKAKAAAAAKATAAGATATTTDSGELEEGEIELGDFAREPVDEVQAETGARRKRIGLRCFNCNRMEGHFLLFYRRMWYSYLIGLTFGLAVIVGPYRCQCCGASRFMMSNLLHPRYYLAVLSTQSKSKSKRRSSRR